MWPRNAPQALDLPTVAQVLGRVRVPEQGSANRADVIAPDLDSDRAEFKLMHFSEYGAPRSSCASSEVELAWHCLMVLRVGDRDVAEFRIAGAIDNK
ncbi:MAG TPA: hypothetical protein DCF65_13680 [Chloroflexi bacterium]|jgi:hypothetical protein|nr:hypothetical protein [Chloroflexota bacterium]